MTLSPAHSSTSTSSWSVTRLEVDACALACAVAAGVHGALVVPHSHESVRMLIGFLLATVALTLSAVALAVVPGPRTAAVASTVLSGVAAVYVLSRTSGIPGLVEHPEPFDPLGVATSLLEVAAVVVLTRHLNPRRTR